MRGGAGMTGASASRSRISRYVDAGRRARLDPELLLQQRGALLIEMQRRGTLAAARVTAHQRAPGLFVERIEAEQLLGVLDRIPEGSIVFEKVDKTRENLSRTLTETFPVRINPLARAVGEDVALIQTCRLMQGGTVSRQAAIGGGLEGHQVHDRAGSSAPRERARARIDEGIQPGPRLPEVVQLAAEIGQRLGVARFRPEGACDPLTWIGALRAWRTRKAMSCCCRALGGRAETRPSVRTRNPPSSSTRTAGGTATFQDYMLMAKRERNAERRKAGSSNSVLGPAARRRERTKHALDSFTGACDSTLCAGSTVDQRRRLGPRQANRACRKPNRWVNAQRIEVSGGRAL